MKKIKDYIINIFNGFCMALSDSVPGVSGGTVAFLLGFYDNFINSLDALFRGSIKEKKKALIYLIKIGIGWVIGFLLAATVLSNLFSTKIYMMSSLFIGFIIFAIPVVIKEEKNSLKGNPYNMLFIFVGLALVVAITLFTLNNGLDINLTNPNLLTYIYVFFTASIAITAMVLPGISGSTLLLVFGLYIPIMTNVKELLNFNFSVLPILIVFGLGVLFGIVTFVRIIKNGLKNHRSVIINLILGMMIGSLFSIVMGPTTLDEPMEMLTIYNFDFIFFIIGALIIILLETVKKIINKNN